MISETGDRRDFPPVISEPGACSAVRCAAEKKPRKSPSAEQKRPDRGGDGGAFFGLLNPACARLSCGGGKSKAKNGSLAASDAEKENRQKKI